MKNLFRKTANLICILLAILVFISLFTVPISAVSTEDVPYKTYTFWEGYSQKTAVPVKAVYKPVKAFSGANLSCGNFVNVQQVFSDGTYLYVVDSGNSRIVIFDTNYSLVKTIEHFEYNGELLSLSGVRGIYVFGDEMYIADTDNSRVLCCKNNEVFNVITKPDSTAIPKDFLFSPTRVIKDNNGYLYVLCDGSYYGLMVFSDTYEFCGFYGANTVTSSVFGAIKNFVTSIFETEAKHNASIQALPYQIIDVCIDKNGFLCTVNNEEEGQIRRFGSDGSNILVYNEQFDSGNADSFNFGDFPVSYIDTTSKYSAVITQNFNAVTVDSDGYIYGVDSTQGRIYMYDMQCKLLNVFGGGVSDGDQVGTFVTANSITCFGDDLLVSDFVTGRITVFRTTEYGKTLKKANLLTNAGKYSQAKEYWTTINKQDKNCQLAYKGLAKAELENENYEQAMHYAKTGLDRVTYADAFKHVRNSFISRNFWWISLCIVVLISLIVAFLIVSKNKNIVFVKQEKIKTALGTIIHPINTFSDIKFKNKGSVLIATIILFLFYATTVISKLKSGFMYVIVNTDSFNALFTLFGTVGVLLLWVLVNWVVCMLADGKGTLKDVYCASCYCLIPKIIYSILFLLLSHFTIATSNSAFTILANVFNIILVVLLLLSMTVIQDYSFFKAIGMAVVTVIGMAIGTFIIFVILTLGQDFISFIVGLVKEVVLR